MLLKSKLGKIIMVNKQVQKAGDNSQQIQTEHTTVNNYIGIEEKRVREICDEVFFKLKEYYTKEALEIANERVADFENRLITKLKTIDGSFQSFTDPSFQLLLMEAQKRAAATERPADYDLLSELLIQRFQKGNNRIIRTGISHAVKIIDEVSDDALLGLTIFYSMGSFFPMNGEIILGLNDINEVFDKLIYGTLPKGTGWLDQLDILGAIRVSNFGRPKKFEQYYSEIIDGYISTGIRKNSDNFLQANRLIELNHLPQSTLIEHELNPDFVRLKLCSSKHIDSIIVEKNQIINGMLIHENVPLSDIQKKCITEILDLYDNDTEIKQQNIIKFIQEWNKIPNLKAIREWWNNIHLNIQLTSVGRILAQVNAQRCDNTLPTIIFEY